MIWIRIMGLALLVLSCTIGGIYQGARYQQRISAIERARTFILTLRHTLRFTLAPPAQLLTIMKNESVLSGCDYLAEAAREDGNTSFKTMWAQAVQTSVEPLDPPERGLLASVGDILGTSDLDTQIGQLDLLSEQLDTVLAQARVSCEKNQRLSVTLGALLGLSLAVILF
ncbi:MAG: stage III sporulation protein AB [Candidatus Fimivivens sp.]